MIGPHASDDRLIDLARGLLPPEERQRTLQHVGACATCEERFLGVCRAAAKLVVAEPPQIAAARRRRLWISVAAAAAVVVIALVASRRMQRSPDPGDLDAWLPVEAERVMFRAMPGSDNNALFLQAVEAYAAHDASRVVELLGDRAIPPQYDFLRLLLASALVREGEHERALRVLDALEIASLPQPYRDRARWERYLALERSGRAEEARSVLSDLASRPGEYAEAARQLQSRAPAGRGE